MDRIIIQQLSDRELAQRLRRLCDLNTWDAAEKRAAICQEIARRNREVMHDA